MEPDEDGGTTRVWVGNPWGNPKYLRPECPTCRGTVVANLPIGEAIDLHFQDFHSVALYGDHLDEARDSWKENAKERGQTHQKVECPDCRPKLTLGDRVTDLLFNDGLIVVALGMLMVLLVWFLLYLAGEV